MNILVCINFFMCIFTVSLNLEIVIADKDANAGDTNQDDPTEASFQKITEVPNAYKAFTESLRLLEDKEMDEITQWCPSDCKTEGEIFEKPSLQSYCKCEKKNGKLQPVKYDCEKFEVYNSTTGGCYKLLGSGYAKCVIRNKECPDNKKGISKYPDESMYKNYLICLESIIIVGKCEDMWYYDDNAKSCVPEKEKNTTLLYSDCEELPPISCKNPHIISVEEYMEHQNISLNVPEKCEKCYYMCNEKDLYTYELTIQCFLDISTTESEDDLTTTEGVSWYSSTDFIINSTINKISRTPTSYKPIQITDDLSLKTTALFVDKLSSYTNIMPTTKVAIINDITSLSTIQQPTSILERQTKKSFLPQEITKLSKENIKDEEIKLPSEDTRHTSVDDKISTKPILYEEESIKTTPATSTEYLTKLTIQTKHPKESSTDKYSTSTKQEWKPHPMLTSEDSKIIFPPELLLDVIREEITDKQTTEKTITEPNMLNTTKPVTEEEINKTSSSLILATNISTVTIPLVTETTSSTSSEKSLPKITLTEQPNVTIETYTDTSEKVKKTESEDIPKDYTLLTTEKISSISIKQSQSKITFSEQTKVTTEEYMTTSEEVIKSESDHQPKGATTISPPETIHTVISKTDKTDETIKLKPTEPTVTDVTKLVTQEAHINKTIDVQEETNKETTGISPLVSKVSTSSSAPITVETTTAVSTEKQQSKVATIPEDTKNSITDKYFTTEKDKKSSTKLTSEDTKIVSSTELVPDFRDEEEEEIDEIIRIKTTTGSSTKPIDPKSLIEKLPTSTEMINTETSSNWSVAPNVTSTASIPPITETTSSMSSEKSQSKITFSEQPKVTTAEYMTTSEEIIKSESDHQPKGATTISSAETIHTVISKTERTDETIKLKPTEPTVTDVTKLVTQEDHIKKTIDVQEEINKETPGISPLVTKVSATSSTSITIETTTAVSTEKQQSKITTVLEDSKNSITDKYFTTEKDKKSSTKLTSEDTKIVSSTEMVPDFRDEEEETDEIIRIKTTTGSSTKPIDPKSLIEKLPMSTEMINTEISSNWSVTPNVTSTASIPPITEIASSISSEKSQSTVTFSEQTNATSEKHMITSEEVIKSESDHQPKDAKTISPPETTHTIISKTEKTDETIKLKPTEPTIMDETKLVTQESHINKTIDVKEETIKVTTEVSPLDAKVSTTSYTPITIETTTAVSTEKQQSKITTVPEDSKNSITDKYFTTEKDKKSSTKLTSEDTKIVTSTEMVPDYRDEEEEEIDETIRTKSTTGSSTKPIDSKSLIEKLLTSTEKINTEISSNWSIATNVTSTASIPSITEKMTSISSQKSQSKITFQEEAEVTTEKYMTTSEEVIKSESDHQPKEAKTTSPPETIHTVISKTDKTDETIKLKSTEPTVMDVTKLVTQEAHINKTIDVQEEINKVTTGISPLVTKVSATSSTPITIETTTAVSTEKQQSKTPTILEDYKNFITDKYFPIEKDKSSTKLTSEDTKIVFSTEMVPDFRDEEEEEIDEIIRIKTTTESSTKPIDPKSLIEKPLTSTEMINTEMSSNWSVATNVTPTASIAPITETTSSMSSEKSQSKITSSEQTKVTTEKHMTTTEEVIKSESDHQPKDATTISPPETIHTVISKTEETDETIKLKPTEPTVIDVTKLVTQETHINKTIDVQEETDKETTGISPLVTKASATSSTSITIETTTAVSTEKEESNVATIPEDSKNSITDKYFTIEKDKSSTKLTSEDTKIVSSTEMVPDFRDEEEEEIDEIIRIKTTTGSSTKPIDPKSLIEKLPTSTEMINTEISSNWSIAPNVTPTASIPPKTETTSSISSEKSQSKITSSEQTKVTTEKYMTTTEEVIKSESDQQPTDAKTTSPPETIHTVISKTEKTEETIKLKPTEPTVMDVTKLVTQEAHRNKTTDVQEEINKVTTGISPLVTKVSATSSTPITVETTTAVSTEKQESKVVTIPEDSKHSITDKYLTIEKDKSSTKLTSEDTKIVSSTELVPDFRDEEEEEIDEIIKIKTTTGSSTKPTDSKSLIEKPLTSTEMINTEISSNWSIAPNVIPTASILPKTETTSSISSEKSQSTVTFSEQTNVTTEKYMTTSEEEIKSESDHQPKDAKTISPPETIHTIISKTEKTDETIKLKPTEPTVMDVTKLVTQEAHMNKIIDVQEETDKETTGISPLVTKASATSSTPITIETTTAVSTEKQQSKTPTILEDYKNITTDKYFTTEKDEKSSTKLTSEDAKIVSFIEMVPDFRDEEEEEIDEIIRIKTTTGSSTKPTDSKSLIEKPLTSTEMINTEISSNWSIATNVTPTAPIPPITETTSSISSEKSQSTVTFSEQTNVTTEKYMITSEEVIKSESDHQPKDAKTISPPETTHTIISKTEKTDETIKLKSTEPTIMDETKLVTQEAHINKTIDVQEEIHKVTTVISPFITKVSATSSTPITEKTTAVSTEEQQSKTATILEDYKNVITDKYFTTEKDKKSSTKLASEDTKIVASTEMVPDFRDEEEEEIDEIIRIKTTTGSSTKPIDPKSLIEKLPTSTEKINTEISSDWSIATNVTPTASIPSITETMSSISSEKSQSKITSSEQPKVTSEKHTTTTEEVIKSESDQQPTDAKTTSPLETIHTVISKTEKTDETIKLKPTEPTVMDVTKLVTQEAHSNKTIDLQEEINKVTTGISPLFTKVSTTSSTPITIETTTAVSTEKQKSKVATIPEDSENSITDKYFTTEKDTKSSTKLTSEDTKIVSSTEMVPDFRDEEEEEFDELIRTRTTAESFTKPIDPKSLIEKLLTSTEKINTEISSNWSIAPNLTPTASNPPITETVSSISSEKSQSKITFPEKSEVTTEKYMTTSEEVIKSESDHQPKEAKTISPPETIHTIISKTEQTDETIKLKPTEPAVMDVTKLVTQEAHINKTTDVQEEANTETTGMSPLVTKSSATSSIPITTVTTTAVSTEKQQSKTATVLEDSENSITDKYFTTEKDKKSSTKLTSEDIKIVSSTELVPDFRDEEEEEIDEIIRIKSTTRSSTKPIDPKFLIEKLLTSTEKINTEISSNWSIATNVTPTASIPPITETTSSISSEKSQSTVTFSEQTNVTTEKYMITSEEVIKSESDHQPKDAKTISPPETTHTIVSKTEKTDETIKLKSTEPTIMDETKLVTQEAHINKTIDVEEETTKVTTVVSPLVAKVSATSYTPITETTTAVSTEKQPSKTATTLEDYKNIITDKFFTTDKDKKSSTKLTSEDTRIVSPTENVSDIISDEEEEEIDEIIRIETTTGSSTKPTDPKSLIEKLLRSTEKINTEPHTTSSTSSEKAHSEQLKGTTENYLTTTEKVQKTESSKKDSATKVTEGTTISVFTSSENAKSPPTTFKQPIKYFPIEELIEDRIGEEDVEFITGSISTLSEPKSEATSSKLIDITPSEHRTKSTQVTTSKPMETSSLKTEGTEKVSSELTTDQIRLTSLLPKVSKHDEVLKQVENMTQSTTTGKGITTTELSTVTDKSKIGSSTKVTVDSMSKESPVSSVTPVSIKPACGPNISKGQTCGNKEGLFRFNNSCTLHYECYMSKECGKIISSDIYECPDSLKFHAKMKRCVCADEVPECTYQKRQRPAHYQKEPWIQSKECTGHGKFVVPENSRKYYNCIEKSENYYLLTVRICPKNKKFNDLTKQCEKSNDCGRCKTSVISKCEQNHYAFDKYSCYQFYHCNHGKPTRPIFCPESYIFNGHHCEAKNITLFCDWEDLKKRLYSHRK